MASRSTPGSLPSKKLKLERISAYQREQDFPNEHLRAASRDILFCDACKHTLTWERKDTVGDHIKSKKHKAKKVELANQKRAADRAVLVQSTLTQHMSSKDMRDEFCQDFLVSILSGGLSIEVADVLRPFLNKWCSQAGAMPDVVNLRRHHMDQLFDKHVNQLKSLVSGKPVHIVFDETCDIMDRSVLNIIAGEFFFNVRGGRFEVWTGASQILCVKCEQPVSTWSAWIPCWKVTCSKMSSSESDQDHHEFDDFGSDASTVAFSDVSLDSEFSETSSHGTVEDFLNRWTCIHCEIVPAMESAERMCQLWIEDNECLIVDDTTPQWRVHVMCRQCTSLAHMSCLVDQGLITHAMVNHLLEQGEFVCHDCSHA